MCGRFALSAKTKDIEKLKPDVKFEVDDHPGDFKPRYNIAPTQKIVAILKEKETKIDMLRWGLIPFWAKDTAIGNNLINARCETIAEKPAYRKSFENRRCLIPTTGYYEWRIIKGSKTKAPYFIKLASDPIFTFAGIWDKWKDPEGKIIRSASIITSEPNDYLKEIHDRMPVIVPENLRDAWLEGAPTAEFQEVFFKPYPSGEFTAYEVSTMVNNPSFDSPECIEPVGGFGI